jgi:hypothetical protein
MSAVEGGDLVLQVMTVLISAAPYLKKAVESVASEAGKATWGKAVELFEAIRARFQADGNDQVVRTLDDFADDPEAFEGALATLLVRTLEQHPGWADEVRRMLAEPRLQEIIATNESTLTRVKQHMSGDGGTQRINLDKSQGNDIEQSMH